MKKKLSHVYFLKTILYRLNNNQTQFTHLLSNNN